MPCKIGTVTYFSTCEIGDCPYFSARRVPGARRQSERGASGSLQETIAKEDLRDEKREEMRWTRERPKFRPHAGA